MSATRSRWTQVVLLVKSSIVQQPMRSLVQVGLVAIVFLTGCAALVAGRGSGRSIVESVNESGASVYRVSATNKETKAPEAVTSDVVAALVATTGVEYVSATSRFNPVVTSAPGVGGEIRVVEAVNRSFVGFAEARVLAGVPVLAPDLFTFGVVLGVRSAAELGVTAECVRAQACKIGIEGQEFVVSAVIEADLVDLGDSIFVDLEAATVAGLVEGPAEVLVSSTGLPATSVRRSLDLIASNADEQLVFVEAPTAAAALRTGVSETWRTTIAAMAVLVLAMGVAGQIAIQRSIVRSRYIEIATLRSIGYPPRFVVLQFILEPVLLAVIGVAAGVAVLSVMVVAAERFFGYLVLLPVGTAGVLVVNVLMVSSGSSLLAAYSAAQVSPADILHK